jgi:hypothetical protein
MIAGMAPERRPGRYVFCTTADCSAGTSAAIATFREAEGLSLVLPLEEAARLGFDTGQPMALITLTVHSALDGVGLTAAVAGALAAAGIPCNMIAAFHHDHVFVPEAMAARALSVLQARAGEAGAGA